MLEKLLNGQEVPQLDNAIWGRELFLSLNHWRLDYANDGSRQGYPFDPYLLYFHHLKNPDYVDLVIGNMEALPRKLADVGKCAGPFSRWLKQQDVKNICKINQNLLRKDDFIENLIEISQSSFNGN